MTYLFKIAAFFLLLRYRFQMWWTGRRQAPLKPASGFVEIQDRLGWGGDYKRDPRGGRRDVLYHPRRVQHWIDSGRTVGDCEDHAGYWIGCAHISRLADDKYLGIVYGRDAGGKGSGHAVAVFHRGSGSSEERLWVDYRLPKPVPFGGPSEWRWAEEAAKGVGIVEVTGAVLIHVPRLSKRQALVFGETKFLDRRKNPVSV
jgi:hypothetical protein